MASKRPHRPPSGRDVYGQLRTDDYKKLLETFRELRTSKLEIEREAVRSGSKLLALFQDHGAYWWRFYDLPLTHLTALVVILFGWQEELKRIAASDNPKQALVDFLSREDLDKDEELRQVEPAQQALMLNSIIAFQLSFECLGYYSLSINELLCQSGATERGDFLKAVSVDRTVVATNKGQKLIGQAQLARDKIFFKSLFKRMKDPHSGRRTYVDLRVMRRLMEEAGTFASCTETEIADLVCGPLGLYRSQSGNEVKSLAELLRNMGLEAAR